MNIDQLASAIREVSQEDVVQRFAALLLDWKRDSSTARDLEDRVERYLGQIWIANHEDHEKIYAHWSRFRNAAIRGINGMTMNERLYWFGLFDTFDRCSDHDSKLCIYMKLHAKP